MLQCHGIGLFITICPIKERAQPLTIQLPGPQKSSAARQPQMPVNIRSLSGQPHSKSRYGVTSAMKTADGTFSVGRKVSPETCLMATGSVISTL